ncbi:MAG: PqqD family protein [Anaerolineae bacterium]|nr:PqqD family protein [Anaerolineae bacterium]
MPTLNDVLAHAPGVVARQSEGELVAVLPAQGKYFVLNGAGAEVFNLANGVRSLREIALSLCDTHTVAQTRVESDVLTFAGQLLERGILILVP